VRYLQGPATPAGMSRPIANDVLRLVLGMAAALSAFGCSRDARWGCIANKDDSARWWSSPDRQRSLIVDRTTKEAHYYDNTRRRQCFTYGVTGLLGEWLPAHQDGLFSVGSNALIGVAVYHRDELPGSSDEPILDRAAALLERGHRELVGSVTVTVTPFQLAGLNAVSWDAGWEMTVKGERTRVSSTKTLVEYGSAWVVQISAAGTEDDSVVVDQILGSFRMTDASEGFWPEMNRLLADIGGFSDAPAGIRRR